MYQLISLNDLEHGDNVATLVTTPPLIQFHTISPPFLSPCLPWAFCLRSTGKSPHDSFIASKCHKIHSPQWPMLSIVIKTAQHDALTSVGFI